MKITAIDVFQHDLPVRGPVQGAPYRMAVQDVWHLDTTIVRLQCDDGTVGYGETCPLGSTYQPQHALGARAALAELGAIQSRCSRFVWSCSVIEEISAPSDRGGP